MICFRRRCVRNGKPSGREMASSISSVSSVGTGFGWRRPVNLRAGQDRESRMSWGRRAMALGITLVAVVVSTSRSGVAQNPPAFFDAVTNTHQDGTLGTSPGFWQQMRDRSASRRLAQLTGPGDGNIWTTINGVQYIQMSTLIDATSANFFNGKNPGDLIEAPMPSEGDPILGTWLTPANDLNNYLLARRNEWGPGTGTTAAQRATQAVGGRLDLHWTHEVSLWVEPTLLFRPAVQWSIQNGTILQTENHLNWDSLLAQGFDVDGIAGQRAGPGFVSTNPNTLVQTSYAFSDVNAAGGEYASATTNPSEDPLVVNEWFNNWWNVSGGSFEFPWTALGFTYDWYYQDKGGDLAGVIGQSGLSEFVFANFSANPLFSYRLAVSPQLIDVILGVPEIDPSAFGNTVAVLIGALGLLERRLRRFGLPARSA